MAEDEQDGIQRQEGERDRDRGEDVPGAEARRLDETERLPFGLDVLGPGLIPLLEGLGMLLEVFLEIVEGEARSLDRVRPAGQPRRTAARGRRSSNG